MRVPSVLTVVVFPAPLGPRNPNTSPRATSKETSSNATRSPKRFVRWLTTRAGTAPSDSCSSFATGDAASPAMPIQMISPS